MKARALELAGAVEDPVQRLNVLWEYAQASVLRSFHESPWSPANSDRLPNAMEDIS